MALATDHDKLYIPLNFVSDKSLKVAIFNLLVASSDQFFFTKNFSNTRYLSQFRVKE